MPFADSSPASIRYGEHLLPTSFRKCHWRCVCSLWPQHHPLQQDNCKSAASYVPHQAGSPQNCSHSSLEETGSRQGCAYEHPCTNVATMSEKQHPAKDRGSLVETAFPFHISLLSQRHSSELCSPRKQEWILWATWLQGNQLIHLSYHVDKLSSDFSSSCLNTSLVKSISLLTCYSFYSFPH